MAKTKKKVKQDYKYEISNCTFNGVKWEGEALDSVKIVAKGLLANAESLGVLAKLFASQEINFECLLKVSRLEEESVLINSCKLKKK